MSKKLVLLVLPLLLCLTGCTTKAEIRENAIRQFDTCQASVSQALRPYLFVLQDDTQPEDNYEDSDYYVRYLSVPINEDTEISIILENPISNLQDNQSRVSVTLSQNYTAGKSLSPDQHIPLFAAVVQATGNEAVTEDLCHSVLDNAQPEKTASDSTYLEGEYTSSEEGVELYFYDDEEISWSLTYEGTLPPVEEEEG